MSATAILAGIVLGLLTAAVRDYLAARRHARKYGPQPGQYFAAWLWLGAAVCMACGLVACYWAET